MIIQIYVAKVTYRVILSVQEIKRWERKGCNKPHNVSSASSHFITSIITMILIPLFLAPLTSAVGLCFLKLPMPSIAGFIDEISCIPTTTPSLRLVHLPQCLVITTCLA